MTINATTFLTLWLLFTLLFIVFLFLTLNALGKQNRYKFKLSVTLTALILGLVCFVGIFTDQSLYKHSFPNFSFKDKLSFLDNKDKPKPAAQPKQNTNQNSKHHYSPKEVRSKGYEYEYDHFPAGFKPTADVGNSISSSAETLKVGHDIDPGYYRIMPATKTTSGIISIQNPFGHDVESHYLSRSSGPPSVTTYLIDGQTLVLNKKDSEHKTKFIMSSENHKTHNIISTGTFIVGVDVKPGKYKMQADNNGNFIVHNHKSGGPKYNEILKDDFTKIISLDKGDIIYIKGDTIVSFLPR
ncbi:hypothetical protein [Staphylococcus simulans]|uniref:hypothetical protein n=1 Tax=Staphylococcus simulans TaxID=1286 RepID=UPI003999A9AF